MPLLAFFTECLSCIPLPIVAGLVAFMALRLVSLISALWRWALANIPILGGG